MSTQVSDSPVQVGAPAPSLELESIQGVSVRLDAYRGARNVVLWFSRGYNCPFCRRYMAQLDQAYAKFQTTDTEVLAVGPNLLKPAQLYFKHQPLKLHFLCDPSKATYRRFGLRDLGPVEAGKNTLVSFAYAYTHGEGLRTTRAAAGDTLNREFPRRLHHHALTAMQQGMFIIDRDGTIRYALAFKPLDTIPPIEELLREVEKLKAG